MSQEYIASFNGGELSPLLTPRTDLPIYKNGCATLRNFYVKPTGAVERRQGSEYIESAESDSRLIPFKFNSDESYIIEISESIINIFDGEGTNVFDTASPFDTADIPDIKYVQSADIIYMVCPNKPVHTFSRTDLAPTFVIEEMEYNYPPFIDENIDSDSYIQILSKQWLPLTEYLTDEKVNYLGQQYLAIADFTSTALFVASNWTAIPETNVDISVGDELTLVGSKEIFDDKLENSYLRLSHQRANNTILLEGKNDASENDPGEVLVKVFPEVYVGGSSVDINYSSLIEFNGTYAPCFEIQKRESLTGLWESEASWNGVHNGTYVFDGVADTYIRIIIKSNRGFTGQQTRYPGGSFSIMESFIKRTAFTSASLEENQSEVLEVSFSDWTINTTGIWTGALELEKSIDGGGVWNRITNIADTQELSSENVTVSSPNKEGANTLIRLSYKWGSGTLEATLTNTTFRSEGVVKITNVIDTNTVEARVVSKLLLSATTNRWSYGAFSELRGHPSAIEFWNSRLAFSGTIQDPSRLYLSYTEDYTNFLGGIRDSESIQVSPNTNEPCTWLLSRGDVLYQGTRGSVVTYSSTDGNSITPVNIKADEALEFGGSTIQGIKTNETVVYLERLNKKLREIFYSDDEQGLVSRDLTIMSSEIAGSGFTELVLQRTPDQIIYALREDGKLAGLTYERSQDVFGWAVFDLGGKVTSIAIRPSGTHDELWITIERDNGIFVERLGSREFSDDLLDAWYVDSGVKDVLTASQTGVMSIGAYPDFKVTITLIDHGLSDGDKIRVDSSDEYIEGVYTVADGSANTFTLRDKSDTTYINYYSYNSGRNTPPTLEVIGAGISEVNGIYTPYESVFWTGYKKIEGNTTYFVAYNENNTSWSCFSIVNNTTFNGPYYTTVDVSTNELPPTTGWYSENVSYDPVPTAFEYGYDEHGFDFIEVSNTWSGLTHLEGKDVQVQGDGGFAGTFQVNSGSITTDEYYNQTVIGLRYFSILRPMYIESSGYSSQNYNKNVKSATIGFYRTINGYSGNMLQKDDRTPEFDFEELEDNWPNLDKTRYSMEPIKFRKYKDEIGQPIIPLTGSKQVNYRDTLSRIKSMFVIADLPHPMCVTSLAITLSVGGK